jgi:HAD superfamily hydrolase (TIGR01509 family)
MVGKVGGEGDAVLEAALIDFDGTITEPFFDWKAIREEMGIGDRLVLDAIRDAAPEEKKRLWAIMDRHEAHSVLAAKIQAGARELMDWLRRENIPFAVITNNNSRRVAEACARCALVLPRVIGRECGFYKPSPEMPLLAAKTLGIAAAKTVVLGDGRIDMESARGAGMRCILLGKSREIPADFYAADLFHALDILKRIHVE